MNNMSKQELLEFLKDKKFDEARSKLGLSRRQMRSLLKEHDITMKKKPIKEVISNELAYRLYIIEEKSSYEIAETHGYSNVAFLNLLREYGIPIRDGSSAATIRSDKIAKWRKLISKEDLEELYWEQNLSTIAIAEIFECTPDAIRKLLIFCDIRIRNRKESNVRVLNKISVCGNYIFNQDDLEYLYNDLGKGLRKIATIFDVSQRTVSRWLNEFKIEKRKHKESVNLSRFMHPNVDVDFFEQMTNEFAYILGLWLTDGSMKRKDESLSISLKDKDVIDWIVKTINYTNKIKIDDREKYSSLQYVLNFKHKRVSEIFKSYGIVPSKTFTIEIPQIDKIFYPHLIRGIFDGDGCISRRNNSASIIIVSASEKFIYQVQSIVENFTTVRGNIRKTKTSANNDLFVYRFGKREEVISFGDWIYKGDAFGMTRKKDSFYDFKNNKDFNN